jgi:hypothetical protein
MGSQVLDNAHQSATAAGALSTAGTAYMTISPNALGGQIALDARNYNRWRLAKLGVEYVPSVAVGATSITTIALQQNLCLAYLSDAAINSFLSIDYGAVQNAADNIVVPVWTNGFLPIYNLGPRDTLYYSELDTASDAGTRMTNQGTFVAIWNGTPVGTSSVVVGELIVHYVLDLYDRSADYGFTIFVSPDIKLEALKLLYERFGQKLSHVSRNKLLQLLTPETENSSDLDNKIGLLLHPSQEFVEVKENFLSLKAFGSGVATPVRK